MEDIYLYEIFGDTWGIVKANSKEEAEQKVRAAYKKHDSGYSEYTLVTIRSKDEEPNCWFADSPDVLEVWE